jgi:hypothetical protein
MILGALPHPQVPGQGADDPELGEYGAWGVGLLHVQEAAAPTNRTRRSKVKGTTKTEASNTQLPVSSFRVEGVRWGGDVFIGGVPMWLQECRCAHPSMPPKCTCRCCRDAAFCRQPPRQGLGMHGWGPNIHSLCTNFVPGAQHILHICKIQYLCKRVSFIGTTLIRNRARWTINAYHPTHGLKRPTMDQFCPGADPQI